MIGIFLLILGIIFIIIGIAHQHIPKENNTRSIEFVPRSVYDEIVMNTNISEKY